jgi:PAS domain S-box-containing protein
MLIPQVQKIRRSLSLKLSIAVALVVLLAVGLMSIYAYVQERRSAGRRELANLQTLSRDLAAQIDLSLASNRVLAAHLACTRDVQDYLARGGRGRRAQETCQAWLDLQLQQSPGISSIFILSPAGKCLASTHRAFIGHTYDFRPYFREAAAGHPTVSDWSIGLLDRTPHIDSSAPVRVQGRIAGVLVTEFPVDTIERAVRSAGANGRTGVLINRSGIALAHSNPAFQYHALKPLDSSVLEQLGRTRQFMGRVIPVDPLSADLADAFAKAQATTTQQTVTYRLGRTWRLATLTPLLQEDWVVSAAMDQDEIFLPMRRALGRTLLMGLATALAGILVAFATARSFLGFMQKLTDAMGRFGNGDTGARAPVQDQDERGRLSQAFNAMADALQAHQERLEELVRGRTLELSRSERHHRELTRAVPVGIFRLDAEGNHIFANEPWFELTGRHDFAGGEPPFQEHIHPEDREAARALFNRAMATKKPAETEFRLLRPDGLTVWVIARIVPELDESNQVIGIIGSLIDINERKQMEQHKLELEAQLQEAHQLESLGVLSAGVAHNINNILAIIMGTASMREEMAADPSDREAYRIINKACARGRDVVKSMLHFAHPTLSVRAPLELNGLIREVRVLLENTTRNAVGIAEAFAAEPLWIHGDSVSITHAVLNLCLNAVGAMPDGGTLTLRTAVLADDQVEISVRDTGCGMTPEVLAHVLEPFYTTKEVGKGTGLGLSMTYGVVKAHDGTITITSQPGQGTTVRLRFPRIPAPGQGEPSQACAPPLQSMSVCLVDDEEEVRFLMTRMLKRAGVRQVKTYAGGKELLEDLRAEALPDLVILDQNMPGMNGTQTMERIHGLYPALPVLISSGQPDIEALDCFKRPRVAVISKPFTLDEIQAKLVQFAEAADPGPSA